jgi:HAD superfamily hydrolase (TIGR01509 family)
MLPVKAILWDNDGVLVDTERLYFEANRRALRRAGITLTPERFTDVSLRQGLSLLELAAERGWSPERIAGLRKERDALYLQILHKGVALMPGVERTLGALRGKVRMAIVTSAQRVHFDAMHARTGLLPYFEFVLTREDYTHGKPAPDGYLAGLRRLGVGPAEGVAVEDSERGLISACAAGLRCLVVPNAQTSGGDFSRALAVLSDASQLLAFLKR